MSAPARGVCGCATATPCEFAVLGVERCLLFGVPMGSERRRTPRIYCDLGALWRRGRLYTACRVRSLNAHGLLIDTAERVTPGYLLDLQIFLPAGTVSLNAVARCADHGIGASIHSIDDADQKRLLGFYWSLRHRPPVKVRFQHAV